MIPRKAGEREGNDGSRCKHSDRLTGGRRKRELGTGKSTKTDKYIHRHTNEQTDSDAGKNANALPRVRQEERGGQEEIRKEGEDVAGRTEGRRGSGYLSHRCF